MDLDNLEHNTRDGLHIASLAGTWIVAVAGFGGMRDHDGVLSFTPRLPERLTRLAFGMCFRGRRLRVEVTHEQARYSLLQGSPLELTHHGHAITVTTGRPVTCPIPALAAKATSDATPWPQPGTPARHATPRSHPGASTHNDNRSVSWLAARPVSQVAKHRGGERGRSSAEEMTDVGPESTVAGLGEEELAVLRHVGEHWGRALAGRRASLRGLPVDPALHRFPRSLEVGRRSRFAAVDFVETDDPAELVATPHASAGPLAVRARRFDVASGGAGLTAEQQRGRSRTDAQAGRACGPVLGRPLVGRVRAGGDARRARARRQQRAGALAGHLGGDRRADARGRPLLPPADQGLPPWRRVLHRRRQEPRRASGVDRGRRPADRLRPDRGCVDLRRSSGDHLGHPRASATPASRWD